MKLRSILFRISCCLLPHVLFADGELDKAMETGALKHTVRSRSESALMEESIAVEQAAARAKSRSEYGIELRPRVTDDSVGVALRIYLPDRWSKDKLRERLTLVAESERLRIAALEWRDLLEVYRDFCSYRVLRKELALYAMEMERIAPFLARADQAVESRELAAADRAKLYGHYLDLMNERDQVEVEFIQVERRLHLGVGDRADLDAFSKTATLALPERLELAELVQRARANRADYRQLETEALALGAAEAVARSEDGFRFKYIQPEYSMGYSGDNADSWGISASFVLPWGTRNPDIALYREQKALTVSAMDQRNAEMEERLLVLLNTSLALNEGIERRNRLIQPLVERLEEDLVRMKTLPLEQSRDALLIHKRILETALGTARMEFERERLAIDMAEELGTLGE